MNLPLSRSGTWRDALHRLEPWEQIISDPTLKIMSVHGGRVVAHDDATRLRFTTNLLPGAPAIYLGRDENHRYLAQILPEAGENHLLNVQEVGWQFSDRDSGLATTALAMAAWHEMNPFCPQCGAKTVMVEAGWVRRCEEQGTLIFPRTDPAVIVAITNARDELMLARNAAWSQFRYSLSAGFVEPGESFEGAVAREVAEETGLEVDHIEYVASQPWPFPASLMVGFTAKAVCDVLTPDGVEIADAQWVSREKLPELVGRGELILPRRTSISRALITQWYGAELPEAAQF